MTMWEVFTCGSVPYAGVRVMGLLKELQRGERLEKPDNVACSDEMSVFLCIIIIHTYIVR